MGGLTMERLRAFIRLTNRLINIDAIDEMVIDPASQTGWIYLRSGRCIELSAHDTALVERILHRL